MAGSGGGSLERPPVGRGPGRLLLLVGALVVVLGLIAWLLVRPDSSPRTSGLGRPVRPPAVARIDAGGMTVLRPIVAEGGLWSIVEEQRGVRVLVRVDGRTLRPRKIGLPVQPQAVAAGFGSMWVSGCTQGLLFGPCAHGVVLRLDARGKVTARVPVEGRPAPLATGEGAVWAATWNGTDAWLYRIDPHSEQVAWRVSLKALSPRFPCCIADLAAGEGKVWMLFGVLGPLLTVDPQTRELSERLPVDGVSLALGEGAVWVMGRSRQAPGSAHSRSLSLLRVDPRSMKAETAFPGQDLDGIAVAAGSVWWGHGDLGGGRSQIRIFRFDPASDRLLGSPVVLQPGPWRGINVGLAGGPPVWVAADSRAIWLTTEARQVIRVEISRLHEIPPPSPPAAKITRIPLDLTPTKLSIEPFFLWTYEDGGEAREVVRIHTLTNLVTRIPVGGQVIALDAAEGSAWVLVCPGEIGPSDLCPHAEVVRLNSGTGRIRQRIPVGPLPHGAPMSVGGDSLWIARTHPVQRSGIIRVDPLRNRVVEAFPMPCCVGQVIEWDEDLWIKAFQRPFLRRIDKVTGQSRPIPGARPCRGPILGAGSLWITTGCQGFGSPTVLRLDPLTGETVARVDPPLGVSELAGGEGSVWLIRADIYDKDLHVLLLDPASNQIEGLEIVIEPNPDRPNFGSYGLIYSVSAVAGEGALWITNYVDGEVVRIEFDYQFDRS